MAKTRNGSGQALLGLATLSFAFAGCETVEIVTADVASVAVEPPELAMTVGDQQQLSAALVDADGNPLTGHPVEWTSDAPGVALVTAAGMVRGLGKGTARISARVASVEGAAVVTVMAAPSIAVTPQAVAFLMVAGGPDPAPRDIEVTNAGDGTLTGLGAAVTYADGQPDGWLTANLSAPTAPATLRLVASGGALAPGEYAATVAIVAPPAHDSPATVHVTIVVEPPPPPEDPPAAPSGLRTNVRGKDRIDLRWNDNSDDETHFIVERTVDPLFLVFINSDQVPANTTRFEHRGLDDDTRYYFRVRACNQVGCSVSGIVSARTDD